MKFEIINPSDPYTMTAPDLEVAAVAVSLLGDGKYPLKGVGGDAGQDVPPFLFGGHDEWFASKFGMNYEATAEHVLNHRAGELAETLDSVTLGREQRSSLNDIGGLARILSTAVRRHVGPTVEVTRLAQVHRASPVSEANEG
jgi:hypothetical protein